MSNSVVNLADRVDARAKRMKAIEAIAIHGMSRKEAAAFAGLAPGTVTALLNDERVQAYMKNMQEAHARALNVKREDVIKGILDAIDHAKMTNEPAVEIRGWEAIAKLQGYNAPERHIHDLPEDTKRLVETLQGMNEADLAKIAGMNNLIELTPEDYHSETG